VIVGVALSFTTMSVCMSAAARTVTPAQRSLILGVVSGAGSLGTFIAAPLALGVMVAGAQDKAADKGAKAAPAATADKKGEKYRSMYQQIEEEDARRRRDAEERERQRLLDQRPDRRSLTEWMRTYAFRTEPRPQP